MILKQWKKIIRKGTIKMKITESACYITTLNIIIFSFRQLSNKYETFKLSDTMV